MNKNRFVQAENLLVGKPVPYHPILCSAPIKQNQPQIMY